MFPFFRRKKNRCVVIGIHGLANKPERGLLGGWWHAALLEGLERACWSRSGVRFEICYWAQHIYEKPKSSRVLDPGDPLFLSEPYIHSEGVRRSSGRSWLRKKALDVLEKVMDWALVSSEDPLRRYSFEDLLIRRRFPDLDLYYSNRDLCERIQGELVRLLEKYREQRVLLIAHSMGSIIAYDVLSAHPEFEVEILVTIGSPLAVPSVLKRAHTKFPTAAGEIRAVVPESVRKEWWNLADLEDKIALNYTLRDECEPNSGDVLPVDCVVKNDYSFKGVANHHKSYGYLRCGKMSEILVSFLKSRKQGFLRNFFAGLKRFLLRR